MPYTLYHKGSRLNSGWPPVQNSHMYPWEKRVFCWKKSNTFLCMWPTEATTRQAFHVSNLVPCPQNMKKKKMHVLILTRHATFLSQYPYKWKTVHFNVLHMLHTTIQLKAFFPGAAQTRRDNAWAGFWLEGVGLVGSLHTRQPSFLASSSSFFMKFFSAKNDSIILTWYLP